MASGDIKGVSAATKRFMRRHATKDWSFSTAEKERMRLAAERTENWTRWGPYLSERQWGTVREDYSTDGSAWEYFPHDHARSRAYRFGEDGMLGITDRECRLCFSVALWNQKDPILKERYFGLTGEEAPHGEDVKEEYYYIDATPTASYLKALYKYPQAEYPYADLLDTNRSRSISEPEYEVQDTGVFDDNKYWNVTAEYAKDGPNDIYIRITAENCGPSEAQLQLLPQVWLRNTWSWGSDDEAGTSKGSICTDKGSDDSLHSLRIAQETLGDFCMQAAAQDCDEVIFTENETNTKRVFGSDSGPKYAKDAFHRYIVNGEAEAVHRSEGTKCAFATKLSVAAGESKSIYLRLCEKGVAKNVTTADDLYKRAKATFEQRIKEADDFYGHRIFAQKPENRSIARQAYAGLIWTKQFYFYDVETWLNGDPKQPSPPAERKEGRNTDWRHLFNRDIIVMPDKWEYPWYASWDSAFHMIPMAVIDPFFAKQQLLLFLREWYMNPNGQIPAYEWNFSDVNPPVHAWAVFSVYKMEAKRGERDIMFLKRCFHKLMLNFTWWVNRKDPSGKSLFAGGFLGLDNIGIFDRSQKMPDGVTLAQSDGTGWMAFFCCTMLDIALELATHDSSYEDIASKFFEHFVQISYAMNTSGGTGLWDDQDGFYYDQITEDGNEPQCLRVRSMVGLIPLYACLVLEESALEQLPNFRKRFEWFLKHKKELPDQVQVEETPDGSKRHLLAIPSQQRLKSILAYLFDETEFLSRHGVRSLSRYYEKNPYKVPCGTVPDSARPSDVEYTPAEGRDHIFGGNSNWRGPVWFPVNYLIIESLRRYHVFYGDEFKIAVPTGSDNMMTLNEAAHEIARRLTSIFQKDAETGIPPCHKASRHPELHGDLLQFYEYFHPEEGRGVGASHQTGWTALVTRCLDMLST